MTRISSYVCFVLLVIALCIAAGCVSPDKGGNRPGWLPANASGTEQPTETPTPTLTYVTMATPFPVTTTATGSPTPTFRPQPSRNISDLYLEIYNSTLYFDYNATGLAYEVKNPPLIIDYSITPEQVSREIFYTSQYGSKEEGTALVTTTSEFSWLEITVRNKETGAIIIQDGFGKMYDWVPNKQLTIRYPGTYQIDLRGGKNVKVDLVMRVGK
jgi:hypothetical protein